MTDDRRLHVSRTTAAVGAAALMLAGAGIALVLGRPATPIGPGAPAAASVTADPAPAPAPRAKAVTGSGERHDAAPLPDIDVTLSDESVRRAGIETAPAGTLPSTNALTIPGVIEADAYRRVVVTPLVAGRLTRVDVELGQPVKRGSTVAVIYSPALAEAQTRYVSAHADLEAVNEEWHRTQRLVAIGAASRQELERTRALQITTATAVEGARSQLVLFGMAPAAVSRLTSGGEISASMRVPAPIDGVVTERQANAGTNVDTSTALFTIVDLSQVWVQGDLYEQDFPLVRVGSQATITTTAYPGLALRGRVAYIDPQLNAQTRTARVRVEVGNPRRELRLGMFAEMRIEAQAGRAVVAVPREAIQTIGDRQVVYLARPAAAGRYTEREVRAASNVTGQMVEIVAGVVAGDVVVTKGSFFLRAERERLGLRADAGEAPGAPAAMPGMSMGGAPAAVVKVSVSDAGFEPARIEVPPSGVVALEFTRVSEVTCATELTVPSQGIRRTLPLNTAVRVEVRAPASGEVAFSCGMAMLKGVLVVR